MGIKSIISNSYLEDIGDAIRQKRGTEETYYPSQMGDAIRGIEGIVPAGTMNIDTDGTYDVTQYAEAVVETGIEELRREYDSAVTISGCDPLSEGLDALLTDANDTTGDADTTLYDAVGTLISGYGDISLDDFVSGNQPSGDVIINASKFKSSHVFAGCKNIESVKFINPNITTIPNSCFFNCTGLKTIIGEYITSIVGSGFSGCTSLKNVDLPNVDYCDSSAFYGCSSLEEISLPKLIKAPFQFVRDCRSLKVVKLASCTGFTNSYQFTSCPKLTDVYLPNDASTYSGYPWGAGSQCTFHYNTVFDENGEPII